MTTRITVSYIEGLHKKRPPGYSEIMQDYDLPKFAEACEIHSQTEQLRLDLSNFIRDLKASSVRLPEAQYYIIKYLSSNLFSYSSYGYTRGNSDTHVLSPDYLGHVESELFKVKGKISERATDFVVFDNPLCTRLDQVRLTIRELERVYWRWSYSQEVVSQLYLHSEESPETIHIKMDNIRYMGNILNRLSSLVYWLTRYLYEVQNPETPIKQWEK